MWNTRSESITKIIRNEPDFVNSYDLQIVAIGKTMIEDYNPVKFTIESFEESGNTYVG